MKILPKLALFFVAPLSLAQARSPSVIEIATELNRLLVPSRPVVQVDEHGATSAQASSPMPLLAGEDYCMIAWSYPKNGGGFDVRVGTTAKVRPSYLTMSFDHPQIKAFDAQPARLDFWISFTEPGFLFIPTTIEKGRLTVERDDARGQTRVRLEAKPTMPSTPILETDEQQKGAVSCVLRDPPPVAP